jgi:hypothetical protein
MKIAACPRPSSWWLGAAFLSCAAGGGPVPGGPPSAGVADMRAEIERYGADRGALRRFWDVPGSAARRERLQRFTDERLGHLDRLDFEALDPEGRVDWLLLRHEIEGDRVELDQDGIRTAEMAPLLPFAPAIAGLCEARQRVEPLEGEAAARELDRLRREVEDLRKGLADEKPDLSGAVALRASRRAGDLLASLRDWHDFRAGYDPTFSWWTEAPWKALRETLEGYATFLREELAGVKPGDRDTIVGDPIGRDALVAELERAWIPYTPEELIQIADREFAWCDARMAEAAAEMGCTDWKEALERVKQAHVEPGEQPALIKALAIEAADYVESNGLITVPPLAREVWRMNMLSPEAQRTSPFFLGGESILVSFPTDGMTHEEKQMSLRGNNRHFCRATVHHEVIPGHHLQGFMNQRYFPYRSRAFGTPFWTEGWALYWEMVLWDREFVSTPEDRVGALFWRMHRCARIRFSLGFHLGEMTPAECIDFLVERVGHERENAEAEVRRSFEGSYGPLYQLAYMTGALQFRALRRELVDSGRMGEREFHDGVLEGGAMPIELVRARLAGLPLTRDFRASWRFYDL